MKTVTKRVAGQEFLKVAALAHAGETVIVTHGGMPWCKIVPPDSPARRQKSAADFEARLSRIFPQSLPAKVMAEFLEGR